MVWACSKERRNRGSKISKEMRFKRKTQKRKSVVKGIQVLAYFWGF